MQTNPPSMAAAERVDRCAADLFRASQSAERIGAFRKDIAPSTRLEA